MVDPESGGREATDVDPVLVESELRPKVLSHDDAKYLYDQICTNIRVTDDISLKLLGFVPLVSGAGITVLLSTQTILSSFWLSLFVGVFGAVVTFGLYTWEVRNAEACVWLIKRGCDVEKTEFGLTQGQFLGRPKPYFLRGLNGGWEVSKRRAERIVYSAAMIAWLALPLLSQIPGEGSS
jgi:hypothetical protein